MSISEPARLADAINLLVEYLARADVQNIGAQDAVDCIVICASQVLAQAEILFRALENNPALSKTVVIAGGIGHSTQAIYDAVASHTDYHIVADDVQGLPEARVVGILLERFFDMPQITSRGCRLLFEDESTNCGANASQTRKVLEATGIPTPRTCIVIQDPTMLRRTLASFDKVYEDSDRPPRFLGCPTFIPRVVATATGIAYDYPHLPTRHLWPLERFLDLLAGEIPRLRDDENGYGPRGKGFIKHVDVPHDVVAASDRLRAVLEPSR
ncbi:hypothetical protein BDZ85DRAFT_258075 [Elsinoe ampelina]|uniref:DUF218 domain-containing protein n=1 Tax=Elsinoe ampelina TaxID=302913 RepID=A0A6A6GJ62_9PEZI|nr:hypothetical protein BDZ85DRAFT_258075 [Elsinoe ampelina]